MSLRLTDLDPRWIDHGGRHGLGLTFRCMTGTCPGRLWVLFTNPLDGDPGFAEEMPSDASLLPRARDFFRKALA